MVELNLVTLDAEKIKRALDKVGVHPVVIDLFLELHDTTRATQKLCEALLEDNKKMIEAFQIINAGFGIYGKRLEALQKKFGADAAMDMVNTEKLDG